MHQNTKEITKRWIIGISIQGVAGAIVKAVEIDSKVKGEEVNDDDGDKNVVGFNFAHYDYVSCDIKEVVTRVWHSYWFRYEWISEYIRIKKTIRTNIRIYSYKKKRYEYDTNEYSYWKWYEYSNIQIFVTL